MKGHNRNIKAIKDCLDKQKRDYSLTTCKSVREKILRQAEQYINEVDELFNHLNENSASGLFCAWHDFKQDMAITKIKLDDIVS